MTRLVDDLLEVGRLTGGKVRLERAPLDLSRVAGALVDTWKAGGRFLHHEVRTDLQRAWVSADRARVEQIVSNLIDNALKYTPAGGRIEIAVRADGAQAILEVSDTGEGMAPELMARMFDLFVQGSRGLAREPGGLGIGLTMAKRLVELHGGSIRAASAGAGRGATFTVALPAIEQPLGAGAAAPAGEVGARRVLIIEDNRDARESLAALLRLAGHDVHTAQSGTEGIELACSAALDFVLVDIGLPDLDGYEVARRLRSHPATRRVRLVALTGYGRQEDRRRALAAGFDEHLAKPVELGSLETLLRSFAAAA
jgi:CheY-like chemotaxis protein